MSRGIQRERDLQALLEYEGYVTMRAPASLGAVDVIALKIGRIPLFIEVKSTHKGPFHSFGPAKRRELIRIADRAGATPVLVWWPPCKPGQKKNDAIHWLYPDVWPKI